MPARIAASFDEEEAFDPADEAVVLAVTVMVVVVVADVVSFGPVEPDVLLLITRPVGTRNALTLLCDGVSQVPSVEFPVPEQKSCADTAHISCPPSLEAESSKQGSSVS